VNDVWLKIKAWTKAIVFALIVIYALLFVIKNNDRHVTFWWWYDKNTDTTVFLLAAFAFLAGIVFAFLVKTTWTTLRQIRELRLRSRTDKLERDMADMQTKAAMLQTKPVVPGPEGVTVQVDHLGGSL
jgi:uncharacterized integral membrane protein